MLRNNRHCNSLSKDSLLYSSITRVVLQDRPLYTESKVLVICLVSTGLYVHALTECLVDTWYSAVFPDLRILVRYGL